MTSWQPGDRVALVRTDDPDTRLRPGDQGTVTWWHHEQGQLLIDWDSGSRLIMLPGEGDEVRLLARAATDDGTAPERPQDEPVPAPPSPREAALRQAEVIGRRHGRAAVHWQIGDSGTSEALAFYRELLRGIAEGDPEVTGLYTVPDLTRRHDSSGRQDYDRASLAADLGLAPGDPALEAAARAYLAAARQEFWLEAGRLASRRTQAARP